MEDFQNYKDDVVIISIRNFLNTLSEFIKIIYRYKYFIITNLVFGCIAFTSMIYFYLPKHYVTKMSFIAPPSNMLTDYSDDISSTLKGMGLNNLFQPPSILLTDPNSFWIEILRSRTVSEYVDTQNNIKDKNHFIYMDDVYDYLNSITEIKSEKGLIKIEVKTSDKNEGLNITKSYIDKLSKILNEMNLSNTKEQRIFLENRIEKVHNSLLNTSKDLARFSEEKKILSLETQGKEIMESITKLKSEIISLESELIILKSTYTDKSPKVKALNENIELLKEKLNNLNGQTKNNSGELNITDIPSASIDYIEKSRNTELLGKILETLTREYEILKIKEAKGGLNIKIIDFPNTSEKLYGTNKKLTLLICIILLLAVNFLFVSLIYIKNKLKQIDPEIYSSLSKLKV